MRHIQGVWGMGVLALVLLFAVGIQAQEEQATRLVYFV